MSSAYNLKGGKYGQSMASLCVVLLLLSVPLVARAVGLPSLSNLASDGFDISAEVKMLDSGQVVAQQQPRAMLTPASLSKLYVAGAALDRYGPQYRFTTSFYSSGKVRGNVLHGDLIVDGGGDPAMTTERYWTLVQQLRAQGIQRITGRVVLSQWPFGPTPCVVTDRCQARATSSNSYDALLSPVAVDYAAWCTQVIPGTPGSPARVAGCFSATPLLPVTNKVKTVGDSQPTQLSARRTTSGGQDTLMITGQVSTSSGPTSVYRSASDPAQETVMTLRQLFQQSGVSVAEGFAVSNTVTPRNASLLASVQSQPLQMALMDMLNYSNNFMADMLTVDLSATTPASLASGTAALERFVDKVPGHGPLTLGSGSGLTPESHTSAHGLTALMDYMYHQPQLFPTFSAGMQTPSNGVAHHIRHGSRDFQNSVMVKTGTLNEPVPVRAIAGYFRGKSGRWGTFAVLVQGRAATPYLTWSKVMEAVADDMGTIIAHN